LISQWGHDFRTDYMRLGAQADALEAPVRIALTATAAPPVRQEISRRLGLRDPIVVIGNFDRPISSSRSGASARSTRNTASSSGRRPSLRARGSSTPPSTRARRRRRRCWRRPAITCRATTPGSRRGSGMRR
jgi:hypothetical protein